MNAPGTPLEQLARAHGIQTSYITMTGERVDARPDALAAVLRVLGIEAASARQVNSALRAASSRLWQQPIEPVTVQWDRKQTAVRIHLPRKIAAGKLRGEIILENGRQIRLPRRSANLAAEVRTDGRALNVIDVTLPPLPFGYHELQLEAGNERLNTWIIAAPRRAWSQRDRRDWGIFLPMYAARSKTNWGTGNLSDWRRLCEWTASLGGTVVGTLPLTAAFLDFPKCDPSPYSPASRLFWNEFYLDITRLPEFQTCAAALKRVESAAFQRQLERFRANDLVDYEAEWRARREILELLADEFFAKFTNDRQALQDFLKQRPEAEDYAAFRAVCDRRRESWHIWPARLRQGELRNGDFDERAKQFHLYIQWRMQQQVDELIGCCRQLGVQSYLDLPLGVHPDGYDVWRQREAFAFGASAGAPPDSFFTLGQDWGFAPLHPRRMREQRYRYVIDYLRFQMRHTGMLRIDHVMGLHRLYWIPHGFKPTDGVYVSYPAEELHSILSLESHRHKTVLIGENLGTVPPEVNAAMERHDLRGMFVVQYQQSPDPKQALQPPNRKNVASLNTHDIPTFAAHWKGLEILDHERLGLVPTEQVRGKRANRRRMNEALAAFLKRERLLAGKPELKRVLPALLKWLAKSPAELVLLNLEDLLFEELPQNMPGTYKERPNWRRKAKRSLEDIFNDRKLRATLRKIAAAR